MKAAIILLVSTLYGAESPVQVNSVELREHGSFVTTESCQSAIEQKPVTIINDTGAKLNYKTSGICVDTVQNDRATHLLSLSIQTIYSGYGIQVSDAVTSIPFDSHEACESALNDSVGIIPDWARPYTILSGKCSEV